MTTPPADDGMLSGRSGSPPVEQADSAKADHVCSYTVCGICFHRIVGRLRKESSRVEMEWARRYDDAVQPLQRRCAELVAALEAQAPALAASASDPVPPPIGRIAELCAEWKRRMANVTAGRWYRDESRDGYYIRTGGPGVIDAYLVISTGAAREPDREWIVWMRNHAEEIIAALESSASSTSATTTGAALEGSPPVGDTTFDADTWRLIAEQREALLAKADAHQEQAVATALEMAARIAERCEDHDDCPAIIAQRIRAISPQASAPVAELGAMGSPRAARSDEDDFTHYFNATGRLSQRVRQLEAALRLAHACATLRDDGTCDGCFVSEVLFEAPAPPVSGGDPRTPVSGEGEEAGDG